ncbi:MAG: hypothetical protein NT154_47400 [Verrucomicrobia bacterium]|nr:hypothetical protein [Verrucomicrobiota bacterium]
MPEASEYPDKHRQHHRVQRIQPRGQLDERLSLSHPEPAKFNGLFHRMANRSRMRFGNLVNAYVERRSDKMADLLQRLIEDNLLEPTRDLFPFTLCSLIEMVSVGIEALVEKAHNKQRFISAA